MYFANEQFLQLKCVEISSQGTLLNTLKAQPFHKIILEVALWTPLTIFSLRFTDKIDVPFTWRKQSFQTPCSDEY